MTLDKESVFKTITSQSKPAFEQWYQGDPFPYLDLMADEMTYFSPFASSRMDGRSIVVDNIAPIKDLIQVPKHEILDADLQLGEGMAVYTFHLYELDENGSRTAAWKVTEVYRQFGDDWRIIHAHYSAIVEDQ